MESYKLERLGEMQLRGKEQSIELISIENDFS